MGLLQLLAILLTLLQGQSYQAGVMEGRYQILTEIQDQKGGIEKLGNSEGQIWYEVPADFVYTGP